MRVGIIGNSDNILPLAYTLAAQKLQVYIFYSPSADAFLNQKVTAFVKQYSLPYSEELNTNNDLYRWLQQGNYDACFILGYNKLIAIDRLKNCPTPIFNIHFGPLPAFKGPTPVFWQLKKGVDKVGLAIHRLSAKFDDGPVVWTKQTGNLSHYNYQTVNLVLSQLCVEGAFYILSLLMQKMPIPVINTSGITRAYQKRPSLNDVLINWQQMGAAQICNLVRAGNPWNKGAVTFFKGQEIKLLDARIVDKEYKLADQLAPGTIIQDVQFLHIYCNDAQIININMLFFNDAFVSAYNGKDWGLVKGEKLG